MYKYSHRNEAWLKKQAAKQLPAQAVAYLPQVSCEGPLYNTLTNGLHRL